MTIVEEHYDRLLAPRYTWMLGGDIQAVATGQARLLTELGVAPGPGGGLAVDLGCGSGGQTLALAGLGFTEVIAVDASRPLLDELAGHAGGDPAIHAVQADIRTALPQLVQPGAATVVVCMGDTLTHLTDRKEVTSLLDDASQALAEGGRFVVTYRDFTRPLTGTDRFIPVRSTEDQVMTCFLEYVDDDIVLVHDLLHIRTGDSWDLQVGSYPKLRLSSDWLAAQCLGAGLTVQRNEIGPRGMRVLLATKN